MTGARFCSEGWTCGDARTLGEGARYGVSMAFGDPFR